MSFTEYRSKSVKLLWSKYNRDRVIWKPGYSFWRMENICAEHWKRDDPVIYAVQELENYLVNDLHVVRI